MFTMTYQHQLSAACMEQACYEVSKDEDDGNDGDDNVSKLVTKSQQLLLILCRKSFLEQCYISTGRSRQRL